MSWSDELCRLAERDLPRILERHPGLQIDVRRAHVATNWAAFGSNQGRAVILKHFAQPTRWLNEVACLKHLACSGTVPEVIDGDCDAFLLAERLSGDDANAGYRDIHASSRDLQVISLEIGSALGRLVNVPLPISGSGYCPVRDFSVIVWRPDPQDMLRMYLTRIHRIIGSLPGYGEGIFRSSLSLLEAQIPLIASARRCLFHEDIANLKIDRGRFTGFFDFEMCRAGTDLMQLGIGLQCCGPGRLAWAPFKDGFETTIGKNLTIAELRSAIAMYHLYAWIRVCRWGWWDGDPAQIGHLRDSESEMDSWRSYLSVSIDHMKCEPDLSEALGTFLDH